MSSPWASGGVPAREPARSGEKTPEPTGGSARIWLAAWLSLCLQLMVLYIPRLPDQISLAPVWGDKLVHGFVFALAVWCWNNALGLAGRQAAQPSSELPAPAEDSPGVVLKPAEHSGIHRIIHRIGRLPKGGPRLWLVAAIFAVHALVSEMIQGRLLPARSADPSDCLADLVGIALAVSLAMWAARSARRPVVDPA